MKIIFHPQAWEDYCWWQQNDRRQLKRINELIRECNLRGAKEYSVDNLLKAVQFGDCFALPNLWD